MSSLFQRYRYYILLSLVVAVVLIWSPVVVLGSNPGIKVWFLDVGQGDAIFLDFADGNQVLIDGGPGREILQRLGGAMPFYDRHIDLVILTHPHKDHIFGLIEVVKMYRVDKIILPSIDFESSFYDEFLRLAESKNIILEYAQEGDVLRIGEYARFDFLSGPKNQTKSNSFSSEFESFGEKGMTLNDSSLVSKFVFGKTSFLFMADAGFEIEEGLVDKYDIDADVLKVGHHGSKYSTSEIFLKEVAPGYSVVQVGEGNRYGHPTQQTLSRLNAINTKILRNDLDGNVLFVSDGADLRLKKQ